MSHLWHHAVHAAHREDERGNHKLAGLAYLAVGFFLAPMLIGIPLMLYGMYKLCE